MPLFQMSFTAFGMVAPGMALPDGVPPNFALQAGGPPRVHGEGGPVGHVKQAGQHEGLRTERTTRTWSARTGHSGLRFFDHPGNFEQAEHTCGILGTLASICAQSLNESNG